MSSGPAPYSPHDIELLEHVASRLRAIALQLGVHAAVLQSVGRLGQLADANLLRALSDDLDGAAQRAASCAVLGLDDIADRVRQGLEREDERGA